MFANIVYFYLCGIFVSSILATIAVLIDEGLKYKPKDVAECLIIGGIFWPISIWIILSIIFKALWNIIARIANNL